MCLTGVLETQIKGVLEGVLEGVLDTQIKGVLEGVSETQMMCKMFINNRKS